MAPEVGQGISFFINGVAQTSCLSLRLLSNESASTGAAFGRRRKRKLSCA
jgi:hypothetical protein